MQVQLLLVLRHGRKRMGVDATCRRHHNKLFVSFRSANKEQSQSDNILTFLQLLYYEPKTDKPSNNSVFLHPKQSSHNPTFKILPRP
ncbi:hypothetical protein I3760_09G119000 [Carya illinoinensis]|nr:hypothetical protein I3760_09G119000 [Carya illinoinensis]